MDISQDAAVVIEYTLKLEDGSVVKGGEIPASLHFIVGYGQIMPALEQRLLGREEGADVTFTVPAREAFGEHRRSLVKRKTYEEFPEGRGLEPGRWVVATNDRTRAQYSYRVIEKTDDGVVLDFNHPLAGEDLYYKVKIRGVRPATREELADIRPCEFGEGAESGGPRPVSCEKH